MVVELSNSKILNRLIRDVIKGKPSAQSEFYDTYSPLVMGVCIRYLGKTEIADDVFQEAFIKIFKNLKSLNDEKAINGWIKRIVVNTALNQIKSESVSHSLELVSHELADDYYTDLIDKMSEETIIEIVDKLPSGYKTVFNMYVVDGYSHKEISALLKISESTSRSQLTYSKRLLKKYLNEIGITSYEKVI